MRELHQQAGPVYSGLIQLGKECASYAQQWAAGPAADDGEGEEDDGEDDAEDAPEEDAERESVNPREDERDGAEDATEAAYKSNKANTPPLIVEGRAGGPARLETEGGKGQERNVTAVNILRRVRLKLQGRDRDPSRKMTVPEHVQWVTDQAKDHTNLAVMYEGWTAWV